MLEQVFLVLILLTCFFAFYYKQGLRVSRLIKRRVCPVCFAVGSTWLSLVILKYLQLFEINKFLIAILFAQSVVGVSYVVEEFLFRVPIKIDEYILKFGIIIYGTFAVSTYAFINEPIGFLLFIPVVIFGFFAFTPVSNNKNQQT